ncbi:MAG: hypothetical protein QMC77_03760 [Methanocellales archaeon]|nr:hypothetical protein [Methanocellales archaeon]
MKDIPDGSRIFVDAINLAIMDENNIENIATNDPDFDRVKEIKVWKP